jgi:Tfp pilus assembly protein PilF
MRFIATAFLLTFLVGSTYAQRGGSAPVIVPRSINGQIRLGERTAPTGVLVLLDIAPNRNTAPSGSGELGRTMTDSSGKFLFEHLEQEGRNGGKELFAVTVRYPGYQETFQIVDLTLSPRGYANIEMRRDTSRDMPNTPPSGAGNFVSAHPPGSPEAQEALAKGQELLIEKHDPKASIEPLKKLVKLDPQYGPGYVLLGTAYMQSSAWKDAESTFEQATRLEPNNPAAFLGMGASLNEQRDYVKAKDPLRHSLELKPDSPEAQYELARCYWALNDWQDAEGHVRKALELNKDYAGPHVLMGNIYLRHRDAHSALTEFKEFLRLEPEGPLSTNVKEMIGKIEKALQP